MQMTRFNSVAVIGVALVLGACAKADKPATTNDSAAGAMAADSNAMKSSEPAAPAMTDANIVATLDEVNAADSAAGKLASTKGTAADVKSFGVEMAKDHHSLRAAGLEFAKKASITPMAAAGDMMKMDADDFLKKLNDTPKGAAWDKTYIDHEVTLHEQVLQTAAGAKNTTQNADLKALIDKATPVVQGHLDRAKSIQAKLTPAM